MPLDTHSYLVGQGWSGSGTGLREGAISRPLAIPQKKTLAGLGKDRDDAFPFWDHLFSAASKSIQIKISTSDDSDAETSDADATPLIRTSTGILSNRRPVKSAFADDGSGATTPETDAAPRFNLLVTAKREAARRGLYSRFLRGPVLGPGDKIPDANDVEEESGPEKKGRKAEKEKAKKGKEKETEETLEEESKEARRERRRLKREAKELKRKAKEERRTCKAAEKETAEAKATNKSKLSVGGEDMPKKRKRKRDLDPSPSEPLAAKKRKRDQDALVDGSVTNPSRSTDDKTRRKDERKRRKAEDTATRTE
ncbi:hypothetical protein MKEN_00906900 [Mycena kentingensis (nom. inval.)]|nr:hypothetical protein MKEN_00906900 [Mycena kentingensis (nom. inval.)]